MARVDSRQFAQLIGGLPRDQSAQGVVAIISKIEFQPLEKLLEPELAPRDLAGRRKFPLYLILDRIQDPQNFGAILRTAAYFAVDGVIIGKEQQAPISETVIKASAGGALHLRIARETNLHQTITLLKKSGFWIATSAVNSPLSITEIDANVPLVVLLGNEGSGVKKILRDRSDITFSIPKFGKIDSLNVSVAAGIICYEILKQRGDLRLVSSQVSGILEEVSAKGKLE
jgi:23S rRNA (guanosine2251-2'-O)-methyltransferase